MDAAFCFSLLKAHEEFNNTATSSLAHFNFFLERRLPRMIKDHCGCTVVVTPPDGPSRRHVVSFHNMAIERPTVPKTDGLARGIRVMQLDGECLYPREALLRGLTYSAGVFVDVRHDVYDDADSRLIESSMFRNVFLFQMPIAVGSIACNLVTNGRIDPHMLPKIAKVDPEETGGYFIVRGMTKIVQPQKAQRNNILLIRFITRGTDGWLEANLRSIRADDKFRSTSTLRAYIVPSGLMTVDIPYLKANVSMIAAFRVLGCSSRAEIESYIFDQGNCADTTDWQARVENATRLFSTSFTTTGATCSDDDLVRLLGEPINTAEGVDSFVKLKRQVHQQINGELLPHCGYDDTPETRTRKLLYLGMLCRRLLWIQLGYEKPDDRDFEGFKSLQMCSTTLSMLLRQLMGTFSKTLRKRIFDRAKDGKHVDVASLILHMDAMPGLATAFTDGEVTVQKEASNAGTEVIQLVQQVNSLALQSHISRINTPLPKSGKYTQCRSIDPSSLFSVCPIKTPEGEGAGLLQTLTVLSLARVSVDMDSLAAVLLRMKIAPLQGKGTIVWLNSDPIGRTFEPETLLHEIRDARRTGVLPYTITVIYTAWGLLITSDIGVILFPLMHAASLHKLPAAVAECELGGTNLWTTLMAHGIIEYVDAWEALDYTVSFKAPAPPGYTHVAPHPTGFICTAAGTIPFANHNQAPRNSYQSGMAEQAVSAPCISVLDHHEMNYRHILWYPQTPVCTTQIAEVKKLNSWPMGINAIVAIAPAFTSEDCITFSKSAEEFGMFRITVMRSYRAVAKKMGSDLETFEHPGHGTPKCIGMRGECDYSKIGSDGLPIPGTLVKAGDIIIGRTGKMSEVNPDGELQDVRRDRSVVLHCDESELQVIDTVLVSDTKDGHRMVRITTRSTRRLQCGDKISSRHGQKGTIGTMMAAEDMPFVAYGPNQGMRPDVIINLQCINGRMTIGKLLEILYASIGVAQGSIQDATPFFNVSAKWALEELARTGYSDQHTMISGTTGEVFEQPWFLGPCFYQRLKHHVLDKIVARSRGVCAVLTRQPVDGRANNGGQKFGEMEFDAQKANGAAYALYDRSVTASDKFRTMICKDCGTMGEIVTPTLAGVSRGEGYSCRACGVSNRASEIDTTYCYAGLLVKELAALNIRVQHHIGETGRDAMEIENE